MKLMLLNNRIMPNVFKKIATVNAQKKNKYTALSFLIFVTHTVIIFTLLCFFFFNFLRKFDATNYLYDIFSLHDHSNVFFVKGTCLKNVHRQTD